MRAISSLSFEAGISARECLAAMALRIRVNISAIGSVIYRTPFLLPISDCRLKSQIGIGNRESATRLPTRLNDAGNLPLQRQLAKTNAAQIKLPQIPARSTAPLARGYRPNRKFRFSFRFRNR